MSRHDPLYDRTDEVATQFPHLSKPPAAVLALWSFGIVLARSCTLPAVANILSPLIGRCYNTVRQRLREWYKAAPEKLGADRRELEVTTCFAPLLAWILKNWPCPRVALALDATSPAGRLTVLSLSLVDRGTAIPIAWKVLRGNRPHSWKPEWLKLLRWFADQVDPTWTVTVMTDRVLYARWLFQEIVALGWHPMMRVTRLGKFRPEGWNRPQSFWQFVPRVGCTWQGRGVAFPRKPKRRLAGTLLACWAEGHEDGWYLLTDLLPQGPPRPGTPCGCGSSTASSSSNRRAGSGRRRESPSPIAPVACGWPSRWRPSGWLPSAGSATTTRGRKRPCLICPPPTFTSEARKAPEGIGGSACSAKGSLSSWPC